MGIALLSAARLVMAVPVLVDRLLPQVAWPRALPRQQRAAAPRTGSRSAASRRWWGAWVARWSTAASGPVPNTRPLRVLRVVDAGQPVGSQGRMVISGRMADVCAELDRLAAAEEAATRR